MRGDVWYPQVEYFSNDYQVITYDFLGHGESPLPSEEPVLDDYVEQLNNLLKRLNLSLISLLFILLSITTRFKGIATY